MDNMIDLKQLSKTIDTICESSDSDESIEEEPPVGKQEPKQEPPVGEQDLDQEPPVGEQQEVKPKKRGKRGPYKKTKDKVIIQIVDTSGNVLERKTPSQIKPNKRQLAKEAKQAEYDKQAQELDETLGYTVQRLKSGAPRVPKPRTEKQLANDRRLAEATRERHRLKREKRKADDKADMVSNLKEIALMKKDDIMKQLEKPKVEKPKPTVSSLLG